ncbi:hypothetical protein Y032_0145g2489 [Ancylostoma ceylanicum]|uniref:Uncharacterized protein n=1 Tax=Ancylostoma ceylanicum TaxID=53326 RepID=A0A016T1P8_9BILA|nr:hypothetical protein Y032_0145g2489 [Ancylostoma ceylanicum]
MESKNVFPSHLYFFRSEVLRDFENFSTLLQVPTLLVIAKTIIAESFQDEYTSIRCHTYFGDYQCWLYSLCMYHSCMFSHSSHRFQYETDVYLWIAIIVGILSIAIYVLLGVGLQKLRMLSAGVVAAMFVQPPSNVNIPQQGVSHNGITPSAPVAVVPMYPPPVCMVTNPANSCVHCQNSQQYASPTTVPLQPS